VGKERKVLRRRNIWTRDGRRLHESQMRRWQSVVPDDLMAATWDLLPSTPGRRRTWTLREGLVRSIAAATDVVALVKVELWNPYTLDVTKMGPVPSAGLRISRRRWVSEGTVLFVGLPSRLDRIWIRQRTARTLYVTRVVPQGAQVVATFADRTMCPEWRDAALGLCPRSAGWGTALGKHYLVTNHGAPPAGLRTAVEAHMSLHSAGAPHRPHVLPERRGLANDALRQVRGGGPNTLTHELLATSPLWPMGMVTKQMAQGLTIEESRGRWLTAPYGGGIAASRTTSIKLGGGTASE